MKYCRITNDNKAYIVRRYTDFVLSKMDNIDILNEFKNYFYKEKMTYDNLALESEIHKMFPELLEDRIAEEVVGKGAEYAKAI